jgi:2-aminobenzoate-CoA ligase
LTYDSFVRDRLPPPEQLPEFRFGLPELRYPERLNAAAELLQSGAPDELAVVNASGRWTYRELDNFSGRIARLLVEEEGLVPGNRVLLRGPNGYTIFAAWLGILKAGGVVVATMPLLRPGEIATVIERAQISHAIVDSRFIGDFRQAVDQTHSVKHIVKYDGDYGKGELETRCADLQPLPPADTGRDDPCIIAFTSGTTGIPKGCVQFHRDVLAPCDTFAKHLVDPEPGDVFLTSAPMAFTFGLASRRCSRFALARRARRSSRAGRTNCSTRSRSSESLTSAPRRQRTRLCCRSRRSTMRSSPCATAFRRASICPKRPGARGRSGRGSRSPTASARPR